MKKENEKKVSEMTRKELFEKLDKIHSNIISTADKISEMANSIEMELIDTEDIIGRLTEGVEGNFRYDEDVPKKHLEELETQVSAIKNREDITVRDEKRGIIISE